MKIYIAGKITGFDGYKEKFQLAEDYLKSKGHVVLNPAILPDGLDQHEYLTICFAMIEVCDCVYFLDNWKDSYGAKLEYDYARFEGKEMLFQ